MLSPKRDRLETWLAPAVATSLDHRHGCARPAHERAVGKLWGAKIGSCSESTSVGHQAARTDEQRGPPGPPAPVLCMEPSVGVGAPHRDDVVPDSAETRVRLAAPK